MSTAPSATAPAPTPATPTPTPPFWFKQRQANLEPAGTDTFRVTAPNLGEAWIAIEPVAGAGYRALLKLKADAPPVAETPPHFATATEAWMGAFELFRTNVVM